jgi:hypothetical protein
MFCRYCGTSLPSDSHFCSKCGKSVEVPVVGESPSSQPQEKSNDTLKNSKEAPLFTVLKCPNCRLENPPSTSRCDCGYDFASRTMKRPHSVPEPPRESVRTKYIWFGIDLTILSFCIAIALFNLTWTTCAERLDEATKSVGSLFVVIVALGVSADRLWKSILRLEPIGNPLFKKKHRKFTTIAGSCAGVLLGFSVVGGIVVGQSRARVDARDREMDSLTTKFGPQKTKNAEFRKRMRAIRSTQPSTYEEYYQQCLALESLLNQWQPEIQHTVALVNAMADSLNKYPELKTAKVAATVQLLKDMDDKDTEYFAVVREEISKVKELAKLPNSERGSYYQMQIKPVLASEERLEGEESAILTKAQQDGLEVPSDLSQSGTTKPR